jgi:hypothetical protein
MGICYTNSTFVSLSVTAIFLKVLIFSKSEYLELSGEWNSNPYSSHVGSAI